RTPKTVGVGRIKRIHPAGEDDTADLAVVDEGVPKRLRHHRPLCEEGAGMPERIRDECARDLEPDAAGGGEL
ncbi:hypothetical protein, partial [Pseudomonas aeruginosa]